MSPDVAERTVPTNTDVVVKRGNAAIAGFQELAKAYQALATKNAERLSSSLQALAAVKSTTELMALQGKLTTAVFTAAFEPITKPMAALHRPASV